MASLLCAPLVAGLRREEARLTAELQALSHDKAARERELSATIREKEAELSRAHEEAEGFSETADKYKKEGGCSCSRVPVHKNGGCYVDGGVFGVGGCGYAWHKAVMVAPCVYTAQTCAPECINSYIYWLE